MCSRSNIQATEIIQKHRILSSLFEYSSNLKYYLDRIEKNQGLLGLNFKYLNFSSIWQFYFELHSAQPSFNIFHRRTLNLSFAETKVTAENAFSASTSRRTSCASFLFFMNRCRIDFHVGEKFSSSLRNFLLRIHCFVLLGSYFYGFIQP